MSFAADDRRLAAMHGYRPVGAVEAAWEPHSYDDTPRVCRPWYPPDWCPAHRRRVPAMAINLRPPRDPKPWGFLNAISRAFRVVRRDVWHAREARLRATWESYG